MNSSIYRADESAPSVPRLFLSPEDASIATSLSQKGLWDRSWPRGDIPCIKVGSRTLYPVHLLRRWANQQWRKQQTAQQHVAGAEGGEA